jgi:hypothetical protein
MYSTMPGRRPTHLLLASTRMPSRWWRSASLIRSTDVSDRSPVIGRHESSSIARIGALSPGAGRRPSLSMVANTPSTVARTRSSGGVALPSTVSSSRKNQVNSAVTRRRSASSASG